jgi:hypothetical protein
MIMKRDKNISGTITIANSEDIALDAYGCAFIAAADWRAGFPPFCGKPVLPGTPYCAQHAALCGRWAGARR